MRIFITFILLVSALSFLSAEEIVTLKKPPTSLKQWYKPDNKRNVFQHNMFKLRRELQAVNQYRALQDLPHTQKWANQLAEHYIKIAEMVPEWKKELRLKRAEQIKIAAKEGDFKSLGNAIKKLQKSCTNCHETYRAQVAAMYRAPDFSHTYVQINGKETDYQDFMRLLMRDVNRIKIAAEDGNKVEAQIALKDVRSGIKTLRSSCDSCHKGSKAKDYYLGNDTIELMDKLEVAIEEGNSGRTLGEFAVEACAHCHGSHRIIYDLKNEIKNEKPNFTLKLIHIWIISSSTSLRSG